MAEEHDFVEGDPFDPQYVSSEEKAQQQRAVDSETDVRRFIERRQQAYRRVFGAVDSEDRKIVLADLNRFCRGTTSKFHENERIHVLLTGRGEVYERIGEHLRLSVDSLMEKYTQEPKG